MSKARIGVDRVRADLDELVKAEKDAEDPRVNRGLAGRYTEHGEPCCLVAHLLHMEGLSIGQLKELDGKNPGGGTELRSVKGPIRARYTPEAWDLLLFLQKCNDRGWSWDWCRREAFTVTKWFFPYRHLPAYSEHHSWVTKENVLEIRGA